MNWTRKGPRKNKANSPRTVMAEGRQGCRQHRPDPLCETKPICPGPTGRDAGGRCPLGPVVLTNRAPSKAGAIQQVLNPARSKEAARPE